MELKDGDGWNGDWDSDTTTTGKLYVVNDGSLDEYNMDTKRLM